MEYEDSFSVVYERHVDDVYGFIGYRVRAREQTEDLCQATFERALKAWHRFDPERASVKTWLFSIANNLLIDHYRRQEARPQPTSTPVDVDSSQFGTSPPLDENLGIDPELMVALEGLSDRERWLIALRFGGDLTGPEIAEVTGLSLANVQQILSRSLRTLRERLS